MTETPRPDLAPNPTLAESARLAAGTTEAEDEDVHVLHVDDDPDMLSLSEVMLERHDIDVTAKQGAADGLSYLDEARVDCVVSDYDMPRQNGLDFLEAVREDFPDLPFILFTGKGGEEIASRAISAGVTDYLQKEPNESQFTVLANRIVNVVDQYRAKKAVERSQKRFSKLVEHSTDVISIVSADARFQYLSPSAEHILGYEPAEMVGEYIFDYAHPEDREAAMEKFFRAVEDPNVQPVVEFRFEHADGSWLVLESRGRNLLDDEYVNGFVVNSRDITQLRERERELERQNEQLDVISGVVSHDLMNPLNVAQTSLRVTREDTNGELPGDHLDRTQRALDRMEVIINDMLTLAEQGERATDAEAVDLETVVRAAWEMVDAPDATLRVPDTDTVLADRSRLQQLFENLFHNAIQHAGDGVTVTAGTMVDADADADAIGVYVADDGRGIPADEREQVFESGYSTDAAGSGFGLAIVSQIARAHDWAVRITESEHGGARFEITGLRRPEATVD